MPVSTQTKTVEEKLALLDLIPPEVWDFVIENKEELVTLLKALLKSRGATGPPDTPISFGNEPPQDSPEGPCIYFERYDDGPPVIWFHTGIKGAQWEHVSAMARLGSS